MLKQELVKISNRFISRLKITSQDLDHFSHISEPGVFVFIWLSNATNAVSA